MELNDFTYFYPEKPRLALGRTRAVDSSWMWKIRKPSGRYNY